VKILLNLTSSKVSFEYMETTPFIQGVDTRNAIYVYRESGATPALTNLSISYQVQSGRYTLPIGNTSAQPETIGGVLYNRWKFNVPLAATAIAGNIMACLVVVTATGHYKLNILNNVLNSSEFDAFQSGLEGAAETYGQVMESYNSAQTIQDQRITAVENASGVDNTKIELLNTEVFGNSTGTTTQDGLKYIVRTDHEERIDVLEALNAGSRLTALENHEIGYVKVVHSSGTFGVDQLANIQKKQCILSYDFKLYFKSYETTSTVYFDNYEIVVGSNGTEELTRIRCAVSLSTGNFTFTTATKNLLTSSNIVDNFTTDSNKYALSAAKGKYLNDELETLKEYIYQGSQDGVIDRLKEVLDFLAGESESTTLLNLLNAKADKTTTYTKTEVDDLLDNKANADDVYTKAQVDGLVENKADKSTTYTKSQVDAMVGAKANSSDVYTKSEVYTKSQVDDIVNDITVGSGYEMPYSRMVAIFNDAYSSDPVVTALNTLNGEVI